ncbi:hypothetical protein [Micromonospora aurantiaca]|uniref:hypothetical protein n=1 Tax=Micromonospora aurantiaca (nom. illeg.) TaxID=47850 RepID=UPI001F0B9386|nr:hypothetical protein [Micromonospora aurantiaca]
MAAPKVCSNSVVRDDAIRSSATPSSRSTPHLPGLAVAYTVAPQCRASWIAAIPTPPAPLWISTDSPARRSARSRSA